MATYKRNIKENFDDIYFETINKLRYTRFTFDRLFRGKHKQLKKICYILKRQ